MSSLIQRAYFSATADEFAHKEPAAILGELVAHHSFDVDLNQRSAWQTEIAHLHQLARSLFNGHIFLEFAIPRMGKRADAVIVVDGVIFVIEYKVGADQYQRHAIDQALDYSLDLKNFHAGSHNRTIVPIVVATQAPDSPIDLMQWSDDVARPLLANHSTLNSTIDAVREKLGGSTIDAVAWAAAPYKPTPTIVEAAQALYQGHDVEEISRSEAGAENLSRTAVYISDVIETAKVRDEKAICFVTGVPGSGKTLAGLNIANERMKAYEDEHAVFLSGNGPLVAVLREALAADEVEQAHVRGKRISKKDALRHAGSFVQNIHHFRDEYVATPEAPIERVVVFDEAQRAWTKEQASRFMRDKRGQHEFDMSEPQFLLSVMNRHKDWCVVVCLIGGGQEINTGEAGLGEWLTAIAEHYPNWRVHLSDQLTESDYLSSDETVKSPQAQTTSKASALHLAVSVRSFRAEAVSEFVGAIIDGDEDQARFVCKKLDNYPMVLTRDLSAAQHWLRNHARGRERTGLVASSNALRLKPVGVHVKAKIDPPVWFLANKEDVRSSYALEDVATEFDIQGLELDWVGMCWDANLRWTNKGWQCLAFRGNRWTRVIDQTRAAYLANAYRVLLTRARQGMVIFVPNGSAEDHTRDPIFYDETYEFLKRCGITELK